MRKKNNSINIFIINPKRKGISGIWDNNIRIDLKQKRCGFVDYTYPAEYCVEWLALLNIVVKFCGPQVGRRWAVL
jgi:hypothetical protein